MSLEDLDVSVRTAALLRDLPVSTVGELLSLDEIKLPEDWPTTLARLVARVGSIEVFETPGDHDSMVLEPNVRVVANHLRRLMNDLEVRAPARAGEGEAV